MLKPIRWFPTRKKPKWDSGIGAAIERGIRAADLGQVVSNDEVRKLIPEWISKFSTRNQH
jgi:predicted transcriptional regulator